MIVWSLLINMLVVGLCVLLHYEVLYQLSSAIKDLQIKPRLKLVVGVFGALAAHAAEVWVFAVAYHGMVKSGLFGVLEGNYGGALLDELGGIANLQHVTLFDTVYLSATTYTTLGIGDIVPIGNIRFLVGIESLVGLVMITWSASFLYYEMQKNWKV